MHDQSGGDHQGVHGEGDGVGEGANDARSEAVEFVGGRETQEDGNHPGWDH